MCIRDRVFNEEGETVANVNDPRGNCIVPLKDAAGNDLITFTNRLTGGLSVEKIVAGEAANYDKSFDFQLKLTDEDGYALTNASFTHSPEDIVITESEPGVYTFSLEDGQKLTIGGLTRGTKYEVTETSYTEEGYVTKYTDNASGEISNETPEVVFTNTRDVGKLTVEKEIAGNGKEEERSFSFTVTLSNPDVEVDKTYDGVEFKPVNGDAHSTSGTFTLKGGEKKVFQDIPAGTTYTVTEAPCSEDGYETTRTVTGDVDNEGCVDAKEDITVRYTNTRYTADLSVTKSVEGNGADSPNALTSFDITVKLTAPADQKLRGSYISGDAQHASGTLNEPATADGAVWEETFTLSNGGSVVFEGLPAGTKYEVSETSYTANGYDSDISSEAGTLEKETDVKVEVTNTLYVGSLSIAKELAGNDVDLTKDFNFTVTLKNDTVDLNRTYGGVTFSQMCIRDRPTPSSRPRPPSQTARSPSPTCASWIRRRARATTSSRPARPAPTWQAPRRSTSVRPRSSLRTWRARTTSSSPRMRRSQTSRRTTCPRARSSSSSATSWTRTRWSKAPSSPSPTRMGTGIPSDPRVARTRYRPTICNWRAIPTIPRPAPTWMATASTTPSP